MGINEMPSFFSMRTLTKTDASKLRPLLKQLEQQKEVFVGARR